MSSDDLSSSSFEDERGSPTVGFQEGGVVTNESRKERLIAWIRANRNSIAFWIFGLLNNTSYVIMIAGAKEINSGGVGLVFFADVFPSFFIKATGPYWFHYVPYRIRVYICAVLMTCSFVLVAFGSSLTVQLLGVMCSSAQSGFGEASFLALASFYDQRRVLTAWSSGTGFAGVFGFAWKIIMVEIMGFTAMLLSAITLAVTLVLVYKKVLDAPPIDRLRRRGDEAMVLADLRSDDILPNNTATESVRVWDEPIDGQEGDDSNGYSVGDTHNYDYETHQDSTNSPGRKDSALAADRLSCRERLAFIVSLWRYMVPLFVVYFSEYAMQSGTWTAIGFPVEDDEARKTFYFYANWTYQAGVFLSRSSGMLFQAGMWILWLMPVLQACMLAFFCEVALHQFWYGYGLLFPCFFTGLLGGAVYVNAFNLIAKNMPPTRTELALSSASIADTVGIMLSNVAGLYIQACLYDELGIDGAYVSCSSS